jgi:curved DNA-binding protein CbpA
VPRDHTHYDNLKVSRDAPIEVIRAAYKSLASKYHPDIHPNREKATRIMRIINASYEGFPIQSNGVSTTNRLQSKKPKPDMTRRHNRVNPIGDRRARRLQGLRSFTRFLASLGPGM